MFVFSTQEKSHNQIQIMIFLQIIEFLNFFDSKNLLREKWKIFNDINEYKGERIMAFFSFLILFLFYLFLIVIVCFMIYKSLTSQT